jgi:hypothetical protein
MNVTKFDYPVCYDHMNRSELAKYARRLEAYSAELEAQATLDARVVGAAEVIADTDPSLESGVIGAGSGKKECFYCGGRALPAWEKVEHRDYCDWSRLVTAVEARNAALAARDAAK